MKPVIVNSWAGVLVAIGLAFVHPLELRAQANFDFNVIQPTTGAVVADTLLVQTSVNSTYELQSLTATVDGRSTNLTFSSADSTWSATLSLAGLASGQKTLTLAATDVFNNSGQTQRIVLRDLPPTLTINEPRPGTVARPVFPLNITAADDSPTGAVIRVYYNATLLAIGTNSLIGSASIPGVDGQFATISVTVTDSAGQSTNVSRDLIVFTATNWIENSRAGGPILDVSTNSVLFADGSALKTKSLVSGTETVLIDQPGIDPVAGGFTSQGAIFQSSHEAYDLRGGVLVDLGLCDYRVCSVRDDWAVWTHFNMLYLRDTLAGITTLISSSNTSSSLGPNGDLAYVDGNPFVELWVHNYSNHVDSLKVSSTTYFYGIVQTDGARLVCEKEPYFITPNYDHYFALFDGANETILSTNSGMHTVSSFTINAGWVAFSATGSTGINQIWTLSPTGVRQQRTFFGNSSVVRALAPNGELIFSSGGQLYLAREGSPPQVLGAWNFSDSDDTGKIFWQDGKWQWRLGRSLLQISRPLMLSVSAGSPDGFKIHVDANPNAQIILQWSSNLVNWLNLSTNSITGTGSLDFTDPAGVVSPGRFYRAMVPNP